MLSKKNATAGYFDYAKNFTYASHGGVESMQLGNGKWESTTFNSRLQPTQIALGTVQNGTDTLKLDYEYNSSGQNDNNGNVLKQTITVPTVGTNNGFTAVQTYTYDELNRLKSATENIDGNTTASWKQTFTYDRYGNRNFDEDNTTTLTKLCGTAPNFSVCPNDRKAENPSISPTNNRIIEDQDNDQVDDYKFDLAGNTTEDVGNNRFTYDGENKQIKVETIDANGNVTGTVGEYWYDGDGKRVKKKVGTDITIFVYNASGQLVAEYATQTSQTSKVSYLTSDHLGSPRITTDMDGDVYTRRDFMPFGEEIDVNHTPERTATLNYATDEIRQKFTSYERDNETKLDYAQARMHNYKLGRFTSPDEPFVDQVESSPESWNLYSYVRNNPINNIDPSGYKTIRPDEEGEICLKKRVIVGSCVKSNSDFIGKSGKGAFTPDDFHVPKAMRDGLLRDANFAYKRGKQERAFWVSASIQVYNNMEAISEWNRTNSVADSQIGTVPDIQRSGETGESFCVSRSNNKKCHTSTILLERYQPDGGFSLWHPGPTFEYQTETLMFDKVQKYNSYLRDTDRKLRKLRKLFVTRWARRRSGFLRGKYSYSKRRRSAGIYWDTGVNNKRSQGQKYRYIKKVKIIDLFLWVKRRVL